MNKILKKTYFSEKVVQMVVEAPLIAKSRKPGNFVIVRVGEKGERMPLTISDADPVKGTITLVIQKMGVSSTKLCNLEEGEYITDLVGPLGKATHIEKVGTVLACGGGVGVAPLLPIIRAFKAAGNRVVSILAARTKELIILEDEVRKASDEVIIMTDDGSYGKQGVVTVGMEEVIGREKVDLCVTIGPAIMMKFCALLTKKYEIPTIASLNAIMVDGTGMCGACRVTVGGKTKFTCVDGPEFDAHQIDFNEMLSRLGGFKGAETEKMEEFVHHGECALSDRNADWRKALRETVKAKERTMIERVKMPERTPQERISSQRLEVNTGLTKEMAMQEARRCQDCANPTCMEGCPVGIDIPGFIKNIERGEILEAAAVLKKTSALPAVCGRVCPQEKQCESKCFYLQKMKKAPVAIGYLERFAADFERESGQMAIPEVAAPNGIKIAVIGSGPSGLSFAGDMVKRGYEVTVFEALHEIGGVLKYGIPEFRLPKSTVVASEIENVKSLGVKIETNVVIGKSMTIDQLIEEEGFEAVFIGSGAGLPRFMGIPGENANGVFSANEYLTRSNLMKAFNDDYDTPIARFNKVAIVGGGNVAMDAARTALRLGAEVHIVYRRSEAELPARAEEVHHAKEEGIIFDLLTNPTEIIADENGWVKGMKCVKMELGEPDASGRRRPVEVPGSEYVMDLDAVIMSLGTSPNPLISSTTKGLDINNRKCIIAEEETGKTTKTGVYAGGDAVTGAATVILAMGAGKAGAKGIDEYLSNK